MKTQTELKKEIEEINKIRIEYSKEGLISYHNQQKLDILKNLLQQNKEIIELIENSNWISERIKAEYRKHHKTENLFEKSAEAKIKAQLKSSLIGETK